MARRLLWAAHDAAARGLLLRLVHGHWQCLARLQGHWRLSAGLWVTVLVTMPESPAGKRCTQPRNSAPTTAVSRQACVGACMGIRAHTHCLWVAQGGSAALAAPASAHRVLVHLLPGQQQQSPQASQCCMQDVRCMHDRQHTSRIHAYGVPYACRAAQAAWMWLICWCRVSSVSSPAPAGVPLTFRFPEIMPRTLFSILRPRLTP